MNLINGSLFTALLLLIGASLISSPALSGQIEAKKISNTFLGHAYLTHQQGQKFQAMAILMAADKLNRLGNDRQLGQLFLAQNLTELGLHHEAIRVYEQLANASDNKQDIKNTAWLESAKLHLQQGRYSVALASLSNVKKGLNKKQTADFKAAKSRALLETGKLKDALATLPRISDDSTWALYQSFNIGERLIDEYRNKNGAMILHHIGKLDNETDKEIQAIKDQANLVLGFSLLKIKKPSKARKYLERVHLQSHLSNIALLGMGWSYSNESNYEQALVFWLELNKKTNRSAYGYETLLAVPYALAKARAYNQAIQYYKTAQRQISADTAEMNEAQKKISSDVFAQLISSYPERETGWLDTWQDTPASPASHLLTLLLDNPQFQVTLKEYRALLQLKQHVQSLDLDIRQLKRINTTQTSADIAKLVVRQRQLDEQMQHAIDKQFTSLKQQALNTFERYKAQLNNYSEQIRFGIAQAIEGGTFKAEEGL
ncbi:MAG TPA: hypothetical protein ENJ65_00225 [Candidatus Tenderia electrophaga]|uniref:Tetratricopeptide repeat-like domain-containing protein n=1 Tax=Candidatus Tenderia electrophaga TaxID=1748243 RepID=A0A832J3T3_9GAMM|nr:hypothetical protein [Candidatus Tenderia electrophaga]